MGLFEALHEYEGQRLGFRRFDFQNRPILCTHLSAFNRFLCRDIEFRYSEWDLTTMSFMDLNADMMRQYCRHLYARIDLRTKDVSLCVYELCDFIAEIWAKNSVFSLREAEILLDCLKLNLTEARRLRLLQKHLGEIAQLHRYASGPLDPLDDHQDQLRLFVPERPIASEEIFDNWVVLSKHKAGLRILLRGEQTGKPVSLSVPQMVLNQLQRGDKLPLTIGEAWDGQQFVVTAGMPSF